MRKSKITERLNIDPQLERSMLVIEMIARSCSTESFPCNFLYVLALYAHFTITAILSRIVVEVHLSIVLFGSSHHKMG